MPRLGRGTSAIRYVQVARALRERLLTGRVPPLTRLPTQRELAQEFGTTVMTVRQALALLAEEGLVRARHGVGTFAADPGRFQDPIHLASFSEEMARQGIRVSTQILERDLVDAPATVGRALALQPASRVYLIGRVRKAAGAPVIYQRSYLPAQLAELTVAYDGSVPLYAFLRERAGLVAARSEEVLQACVLPPAVAEALAARTSTPGLFSRRTTFDADGQPFLYDEAYIRGDGVELRIYRTGMREQSTYRIFLPNDGRHGDGRTSQEVMGRDEQRRAGGAGAGQELPGPAGSRRRRYSTSRG